MVDEGREPKRPARIALVLSGGGARGAYEAGVLSYLFTEIAPRLGREVHFDIVTGASVGAIHACYVAAYQNSSDAWARLAEIWRGLTLDRVFPVGASELFSVPLRLLGLAPAPKPLPAKGELPQRLPGLFEVGWLEHIVLQEIEWQLIRDHIDSGSLHALAVAATEIATGRAVIFADTKDGQLPPWSRDEFVVAKSARIGPAHALASAAIPLVFPAVRLTGAYYADGGLRLNTPLSPALRLGADRVLVISLQHGRTKADDDRLARHRETNFTSPVYLAGKALNALLIDRIEHDLDRLRLLNRILAAGVSAYGAGFVDRINDVVVVERRAPYRIVQEMSIRPSEDLGALAGKCLGRMSRARGISDWLSRTFVRYAGRGGMAEPDLLSYLLFDNCYTDRLIALGREDAEAVADRLVDFFSGSGAAMAPRRPAASA